MYYTVAQLRQIEQAAQAQGLALMPLAGQAAANFITQRFGTAAHVLVLVGPGNNGGDALVAATQLRQQGYGLTVLMPIDPARLPADAAAAYAAWRAAGGRECAALPAQPYTVVIDGLFGIGLNRPLAADWQTLIQTINALGKPVLALDVPSGVDADQGAILGAAIQARWTLSFIGRARGLGTGAARDVVGISVLDNLALPIALQPRGAVASTADVVADVCLARPHDTHKGRFGSVLVVGGAAGMVGAALLAGRAALHCGAGKIGLGLLDANGPSVDLGQPELMLHRADPSLLAQADVLLLGPGLGQQPAAVALLRAALRRSKPLVLDADALNLIAQSADLQQLTAARSASTIMTPHPSEAARLLQWDTAAVQAQRFVAAQALAAQFKATVVLKGAGTLIAEADRTAVNHSGSAALANAGQGDVLGGVIIALLAQGLPAWQASNLAVLVHGLASDELLAAAARISTPASAVIDQLGKTLARWQG